MSNKTRILINIPITEEVVEADRVTIHYTHLPSQLRIQHRGLTKEQLSEIYHAFCERTKQQIATISSQIFYAANYTAYLQFQLEQKETTLEKQELDRIEREVTYLVTEPFFDHWSPLQFPDLPGHSFSGQVENPSEYERNVQQEIEEWERGKRRQKQNLRYLIPIGEIYSNDIDGFTGNWVTRLPHVDEIREAVHTNQLFSNKDMTQLLKSQLPPALQEKPFYIESRAIVRGCGMFLVLQVKQQKVGLLTERERETIIQVMDDIWMGDLANDFTEMPLPNHEDPDCQIRIHCYQKQRSFYEQKTQQELNLWDASNEKAIYFTSCSNDPSIARLTNEAKRRFYLYAKEQQFYVDDLLKKNRSVTFWMQDTSILHRPETIRNWYVTYFRNRQQVLLREDSLIHPDPEVRRKLQTVYLEQSDCTVTVDGEHIDALQAELKPFGFCKCGNTLIYVDNTNSELVRDLLIKTALHLLENGYIVGIIDAELRAELAMHLIRTKHAPNRARTSSFL